MSGPQDNRPPTKPAKKTALDDAESAARAMADKPAPSREEALRILAPMGLLTSPSADRVA